MKCKKCKMDIPKGAKVCPYCNSKQGTSLGTAIVVLILIGVFISIVGNIGKGARMAKESNESRSSVSSTSSSDVFADFKSLISPACRSIGIVPSEIKSIKQLDDWEDGEQYQFGYKNLTFTARLDKDGALYNICCGTNEMFAGGETLIRYMNGFLVRDEGGTTEYDSCEVNGVMLNATGSDCSYVQVDVGYYDNNGVKITSGLDNVLNLKNGEQWRFKAYGFGSGIKRYQIEDVSWY